MKKIEIEEGVKIIRKEWRKFLRFFGRKKSSGELLIKDEDTQKFVFCHRILQAVIAIVSEYRAGIDVKNEDYRPRAIYKAEGGVTVDHKEIVIKRYDGAIRCYNDWNDKDKETPAIVKEVIEEIFSIDMSVTDKVGSTLVEYAAKNTNVPIDILWRKIDSFVANPYGGDSLRRLFES